MTNDANARARSPLFPLDHLVIAVNDLAQTMRDYQALGFTVQPGGKHPGRQSHNALVVFEDGAYLELIAWVGDASEERWWRVLQHCGEGLVDFALLPHDTEQALSDARSRGLSDIIGPVPGGRNRPDGQRLEWSSARQSRHDLPFLCGDITPRALRVPEGDIRQHANGVVGVSSVTVQVRDLAASMQRYRQLLGPALVVEMQDGGHRARMALPGFEVVLTKASDSVLSRRGEEGAQGPVSLTLRTRATADDEPRSTLVLDARLTHGVEIRLQPI